MQEYNYKQIDEIFHSRIRLAASALLYHDGEVDFTTMKEKTGTTDGNLTTHLRKMEAAGYVHVEKSFFHRKPLTTYRLTTEGRKAFEVYIDNLERILGLETKNKEERGK